MLTLFPLNSSSRVRVRFSSLSLGSATFLFLFQSLGETLPSYFSKKQKNKKQTEKKYEKNIHQTDDEIDVVINSDA